MLLRLNCNFNERVKRIQNRKSDVFDDVTKTRAEKYEWISSKIKAKTDFRWNEIDTSNKSIEEVCQEALETIGINKGTLGGGER